MKNELEEVKAAFQLLQETFQVNKVKQRIAILSMTEVIYQLLTYDDETKYYKAYLNSCFDNYNIKKED